MKRENLWKILLAFLMGQAIQLVTIALSNYLYISDPAMVCIAVAIMTTALVVLTAIFTLMDSTEQDIGSHYAKPDEKNVNYKAVKRMLEDRKPRVYAADPEDIDEIDANVANEA